MDSTGQERSNTWPRECTRRAYSKHDSIVAISPVMHCQNHCCLSNVFSCLNSSICVLAMDPGANAFMQPVHPASNQCVPVGWPFPYNLLEP